MGIYVPWLVDAAKLTGYRVVEVAGWRTRGHGPMRVVEGVVGHHTATAASAPGDYPSLGIVTNGRSDLAGPLANLGLGRDGTIYVIAAGLCYHAGASKWAGFTDLNDEFIGIEAESSGHGDWTAAQRDCYPKLVAVLLKYMSRGTDRYAGHKDVCVPAGRKPDPVGIDTGWMRATAQTYLTNGITPLEDDVSWTDPLTFSGPNGTATYAAQDWLLWTNYYANQIPALQASVTALASAVAEGDLDSEAVLHRIDTSVREATQQSVTQTVVPALRAVVAEVLGEDNASQADAIVSALISRLQS